jgi:hypothetical protein
MKRCLHLIEIQLKYLQARKEESLYTGSLTVTDTKHGVYICWDRDQAVQQQISLGKPSGDIAFR